MRLAELSRPGLFRLVLALVVVIHHTTRLNLGAAAVDLFFVLSGFWIARMWTGRYARSQNPYVTYLASRAWRIMPVAALTAGLSWVVAMWRHSIPAHLDLIHQAISNIVLLGYHSLSYQANVPAWSLDMEFQFYILAPLLVALIGWKPWAVLAVIIGSAAAVLAGDQHTVGPYLAFFGVGIWSAVTQWRPSARMAYASAALGALAVAACALSPWRSLIIAGSQHGPFFAHMPEAEIVLAALLAPWALYTVRQADTQADQLFGDLSFIVYMLHWPMLRLIDTTQGGPVHRLSMLALAMATIGVAALIVWRAYDHPVQRARKAWVSRRDVRAPARAVCEIGEIAR